MSRRYIFVILLAFLAAACSERIDQQVPADAVALGGIDTKASTSLSEVGRQFVEDDVIVLTYMSRSSMPIESMTYSGIEFTLGSAGWKRTDTPASTHPNRIFWSDSVNDHTFRGYSIPQGSSFLWTKDGDIYSGAIGGAAATETVDFSSNEKIASEDILLLSNTHQKAGVTGEATLDFYHGLSLVKVVVDITDYSAQNLDREVTISDLKLMGMPTRYTWTQTLTGVAQVALGDVTKTFLTWQPDPATAEFYSLAVPGETDFEIPFTVHFTDPVDGVTPKSATYTASKADVLLIAGKCTTITINLSHKGESITIGASHQDWEFIETPDKGELMKNVTFLEGTDTKTPEVTIAGDSKATKDDATWLFYDGENLKDIYGNDGSQARPFKIATAAQLLSLAKEVKEGNASAGRTFAGLYVNLDASVTLQRVGYDNTKSFSWPGIGDATHPFQGHFNAGGRTVSLLCGAPLFMNIGENARVENIAVLSVVGNGPNASGAASGAIAGINRGVICAFRVEGNVTAAVATNSNLLYAGSVVSSTSPDACHVAGINTGTILAAFSAGTSVGYMYNGTTNIESSPIEKKEMIKGSFALDIMNGAISDAIAADATLDDHRFSVVTGSYPVIN